MHQRQLYCEEVLLLSELLLALNAQNKRPNVSQADCQNSASTNKPDNRMFVKMETSINVLGSPPLDASILWQPGNLLPPILCCLKTNVF